MNRIIHSLLLGVASLLSGAYQAQAQAPITQWDHTFGGSQSDAITSLQQTTDGGCILGGYSSSPASGDKSQPSQGLIDYWVVKLDANGTKLWDRTWGGSGDDLLYCLQQTTDGGYILGGYSTSPASGDKSQPSQGLTDYWIVKLDASGTVVWNRTFGGSRFDGLRSLQQTSDGGYILGGISESGVSSDKTQPSQGLADYWVVKLDATGVKQWDKTIGGSGLDGIYALQQTSDGGYILGGFSTSAISGDKTQGTQGAGDYWLVKLDGNGVKQWDKTVGGDGNDYPGFMQQTTDGGYIFGGTSDSNRSGNKTQPSQGLTDYWVVKLDARGTILWDRTLGGTSDDALVSLQQTHEGGYLFGGYSSSSAGGDKTQPSRGLADYWVVKLDASGAKEWDGT